MAIYLPSCGDSNCTGGSPCGCVDCGLSDISGSTSVYIELSTPDGVFTANGTITAVSDDSSCTGIAYDVYYAYDSNFGIGFRIAPHISYIIGLSGNYAYGTCGYSLLIDSGVLSCTSTPKQITGSWQVQQVSGPCPTIYYVVGFTLAWT